jgi:hypothetical protein
VFDHDSYAASEHVLIYIKEEKEDEQDGFCNFKAFSAVGKYD